jgi:hypothetical protein
MPLHLEMGNPFLRTRLRPDGQDLTNPTTKA